MGTFSRSNNQTFQKDMAAKKPSKAYQFVIAALKRNRKASFATIRDNAAKKRLKIYPIVYGRAQAQLGIVKMSKRGQGKKARQLAKKRGPGRPRKVEARRGPGRPRKSQAARGLDDIVAQISGLQKDRDRLAVTLEKVQGLIEGAL